MDNNIQNKENSAIISRVEDLIKTSEKTFRPLFLGFLNLQEQMIAKEYLLREQNLYFDFFGGYAEAERSYLMIKPHEYTGADDYPIKIISFKFRKKDELSHRDFLGALLALGIERSTVGDILIGEGEAFAFVNKDIKSFILLNTRKIGSTGISLEEVNLGDIRLPPLHKTLKTQHIMTSLRLDQMVAVLTKNSRKGADKLIAKEYVWLNFLAKTDRKTQVKPGDIITIRGYGRFRFLQVLRETKKANLVIEIEKYI